MAHYYRTEKISAKARIMLERMTIEFRHRKVSMQVKEIKTIDVLA